MPSGLGSGGCPWKRGCATADPCQDRGWMNRDPVLPFQPTFLASSLPNPHTRDRSCTYPSFLCTYFIHPRGTRCALSSKSDTAVLMYCTLLLAPSRKPRRSSTASLLPAHRDKLSSITQPSAADCHRRPLILTEHHQRYGAEPPKRPPFQRQRTAIALRLPTGASGVPQQQAAV